MMRRNKRSEVQPDEPTFFILSKRPLTRTIGDEVAELRGMIQKQQNDIESLSDDINRLRFSFPDAF